MTVREAWQRALGALGLGRREQDLAEELHFHREMLEAQYRAQGLEAAAARRAAVLALGGETQLTESWRDQRGLPFLETLQQDIRYGLRMLSRSPGFAASAILTLTLGVGASTAVFSVVNAVLLRPLPYAEPDRLVTVGDSSTEGYSSNIGFATMNDLRERSRTVESVALMRSWQPTLVVNGEAERLEAVRVSWNYFDMLGVSPALGRTFSAEEDHPDRWRVVLLSDRLWRRRFSADPSIVGRSVVLNDREYRVVGVMPPAVEPLAERRYFNADAEMWAPLGYALDGDSSCRSCRHLRGFARLRPGVSVAQASADLDVVREQMRREHPTDYESGSMAIVPLAQALTGQVRPALLVLLGAVGFVLLIACANVASLLLSRSLSRRRELALRTALGAGRGRITRQLLTESALLGAGGALGGILLALLAVRVLGAVAPVTLPRTDHIAIDAPVLAFTAVVSMLTSAVFGLVPARRGTGGGLRDALGCDPRTTSAGPGRARALLVVVDLMLALVLLAGAGLMLRTMAALTRVSPGFDGSRVVSLQFSLVGKPYAEDAAVVAFQQQLLEKLRAVPGVAGAALAGQIPFGGSYDCSSLHAQGHMRPNTVDDPCVERYGITADYLRVMNIPLIAGRTFEESDTASAQPVMLVSESTARTIWGDASPIGAQARIGRATRGPWVTIVGVVGDVHHDDLSKAAGLSMYTPQSQRTDSYLTAVVKAVGPDAEALAAPARDILRHLDPTVPVYGVAAVPALVRQSGAQRQFVMRLLALFAVMAVLLAAIGLYGVVSYGVSQRARELGVRVALGAQRADVMRLVLSSGLSLVAVGVAAGLVVSLLLSRYLASLVFGVTPADPLTFAVAAAMLTAVALLAQWVPVRRALRIDPAVALRAE